LGCYNDQIVIAVGREASRLVTTTQECSEMTSFRTLDEVDVTGKRVLLRVDLNVPIHDGGVRDPTRIQRIAPTIAEIAGKGGKVILLSHLGRPKGPDPKQSLRPVAAALSKIMGRPVAFVPDCIGPAAERATDAMQPGDVVCLDNTRFYKGEEQNDKDFVAALAKLGDIWVNDAFSAAHRAHASTEGLGHVLPAYAGRAIEAELDALESVLERPAHPVTAIVGGAKVSTKLDLLANLLKKIDVLAIGGAMANTFLFAQGHGVGKSLYEPDLVGTAREILDAAGRCEILLPIDAVVSEKLALHAPSRVVTTASVGEQDRILDIGPRSAGHVVSALARSKTLLWNGPVGAFEVAPFEHGTIKIAEAAAELTDAGKLVSVAGGGDTVAALNAAGVTERFSFVSTAGGAFLEWLEGKALPGVEILKVRR
jgi:phosphoglycerate kinase